MSKFSALMSAGIVGKYAPRARRHTRLIYRSRANLGASFAPLNRLLNRRQQQCILAFSPESSGKELSTITSQALVRSAPRGTAGRVRRLYRVARRTRDLLRGLRAGRDRRRFRCKRKVNVTASNAYIRRASRHFGRHFVEQAHEVAAVAPLVFQRPTILTVKTEQTKQREFAASVVARENRFRFTAQYLESITKYIPALVNQLFSKRIKDCKLPPIVYHAAKHRVRNIYLSLRVYLNVDPLDNRFFLKDRNLSGRVAISDTLAKRALHQKTPH
jgi:hypothetical protein